MVATVDTAKSEPAGHRRSGSRLSFDERAATSVLVLSRTRTTSRECWMTKSKLVALAIVILLASPSAGFAAGASAGGGGVGYGSTGTGRDTVGADVVNIPDMAIGGPPALDVTKDLPATAPTTAPQRTPGMKPSSRSAPPQ